MYGIRSVNIPSVGRADESHETSVHSEEAKPPLDVIFPEPEQSLKSAGMFCLSEIEHDLPIPPCLLNRPLISAIKEELERLFLDKVIANLGLCISIYDVHSVEGGFIFPGDGSAMYKVKFRMVVFRPFIGEILMGKIESSDEDCLRLSLGFFNDIYIPEHRIARPCKRGDDGIWYGFMRVRFRVLSIKYPPVPNEQKEDAKPFAPMEIIGETSGDGLGLPSWWGD
uniref:DNA-directed RNA polymerase subunit n=1 Tax=Ananas comosus var. bracteatus TaxID=296719 RepID=A0A6V7NJK5_ANACO|nr:unnamed protein product [Ananas comosus var. bracteatus]